MVAKESSATPRRTNRANMSGRTSGPKTILNTLIVNYDDRIAASTIN